MKINKLIENLKEILYQATEQTIYLYEMSQPQAKVRENIRNLSKPIFKHLIKVVLYGKEESKTLHHWANKLNNWLDDCMDDKIKKSGKDTYPNYDELLKWLTDYYANESDIERMRSNIEKQYIIQGHASRLALTNKQVYQNCYNIVKECCSYVVNNTLTDDIILNIFEKYILA